MKQASILEAYDKLPFDELAAFYESGTVSFFVIAVTMLATFVVMGLTVAWAARRIKDRMTWRSYMKRAVHVMPEQESTMHSTMHDTMMTQVHSMQTHFGTLNKTRL